jgi:hypothetical protein
MDSEVRDPASTPVWVTTKGADSRLQALQRVAIVAHWANEQAARLEAGRPLRLDHATVVAEAITRPARRSAA